MIEDNHNNAKERMEKTLHAFEAELSKLRAGRATPSILDSVLVNYHGSQVPINQVASVVTEGARMLLVKPWEKPMFPIIEKAILTSDLGLNPSNSGDMIRVPMPALNEERRRELIKHVRSEAEDAKVAMRNIRRDANQELKNYLKDKLISEDEARQSEERIQKLTNTFVQKIDKVTDVKEKDLMEL